jgi:hypothetical protein
VCVDQTKLRVSFLFYSSDRHVPEDNFVNNVNSAVSRSPSDWAHARHAAVAGTSSLNAAILEDALKHTFLTGHKHLSNVVFDMMQPVHQAYYTVLFWYNDLGPSPASSTKCQSKASRLGQCTGFWLILDKGRGALWRS